MKLKRHYLVEITDEGREWIYSRVIENGYHLAKEDQIKELIVTGYGLSKVPGIARREESEMVDGTIPIGFASPSLHEDMRLRIPAFVIEEDIVAVITPYEVLQQVYSARTDCLKALNEIRAVADKSDIELGIWGSAGLEVYTGLPYTHDKSDLDLIMGVTDFETMKNFYMTLQRIGERYSCRIDMELDLPNGFGIKFAELLMETKQVLAKGLNNVTLIPKKKILDMVA